MVPLRWSALVGRRGCGHVRRPLWSHGDGWGMAAVSVIRASRGSGLWRVACKGIGKVRAWGLPGCLVRALQMAVSAARASSSVWMAGDTCSAASVRIWWIARTAHSLSEAGRRAVRSWGAMASVCCRPSRWNLHAADQSLVCGNLHWAHRHGQ